MSPPDLLDERIRTGLSTVPVSTDHREVVVAARHQARRRIRRRRLVTAAVPVALVPVVALVVGLTGSDGGEQVVTDLVEQPDAAEERDVETSEVPPRAPLSDAYLSDTPILPFPRTEVLVDDMGTLSAWADEHGQLTVHWDDADSPGAGSMTGDGDTAPSLTFFTSASGDSDPHDAEMVGVRQSIVGVTRSEVVRLELTTTAGRWSVATVDHPSIPGLRFFALNGELGPMPTWPSDPAQRWDWSFTGYDAGGQRIVEWEEVFRGDRHWRRRAEIDAADIAGNPSDTFLAELAAVATEIAPSDEVTDEPLEGFFGHVNLPTWVPEDLTAASVTSTESGYEVRYLGAGDRSLSIASGGRAGPANVDVVDLTLEERMLVKRSLRPYEP